jgi:hypothetical protein
MGLILIPPSIVLFTSKNLIPKKSFVRESGYFILYFLKILTVVSTVNEFMGE